MKLSVPSLVGITWLLVTTVDVSQCDCSKKYEDISLCTAFSNLKKESIKNREVGIYGRQKIWDKFDCFISNNSSLLADHYRVKQNMISIFTIYEQFEKLFSDYCDGIFSEDTFSPLIKYILNRFTYYDDSDHSSNKLLFQFTDSRDIIFYFYDLRQYYADISKDLKKDCGVQFIEKHIYDMDQVYSAALDLAFDMALLSYRAIRWPEIQHKLPPPKEYEVAVFQKLQKKTCFDDHDYKWRSHDIDSDKFGDETTLCSAFLFERYQREAKHNIEYLEGQREQIFKLLKCLWPTYPYKDIIKKFESRIKDVSNLFNSFENKLYSYCTENILDNDLRTLLDTASHKFTFFNDEKNRVIFYDYIRFTSSSSNPYSQNIFKEIGNPTGDRLVSCAVYEDPKGYVAALYYTALTQMYEMLSFQSKMTYRRRMQPEFTVGFGKRAKRKRYYFTEREDKQAFQYLFSTFEILKKNLKSSIKNSGKM